MRRLTHPHVNGVTYLIVPGKFCLVGQLFLASAIKPREYPTGINTSPESAHLRLDGVAGAEQGQAQDGTNFKVSIHCG
jgi:hypothetical protein